MDWNTKHRQNELNAWQKASLNQILGASKPIAPAPALWRALEAVVTFIGLLGIAMLCLWIAAAFVGFYWEMASSGFAFGRGALRWLLEMPR